MGGVGIYAGLTNVPTVSEMLAVMIGLGVGIDYALFVVTRHRQHLHEGMRPEDAAGQATATAGQSVLFAGTTVCIAIFGLLLAGVPAITAMGFAIGIAVIFAMAIAVTLLPGLLGLAGHRIDSLAVHRQGGGRRGPRDVLRQVGPPRRPAAVALRRSPAWSSSLVAAVPVLDLRIGFSDDSNEAKGSTARESYELLAESFGPGFSGTLNAVIELPAGDTTAAARVHDAVAATPGVASVGEPIDQRGRRDRHREHRPDDLAAGRGDLPAGGPPPRRRAAGRHRRHRRHHLPDRPDRLPGGRLDTDCQRPAADVHAGGRSACRSSC